MTQNKSLGSQFRINSLKEGGSKISQSISQDIKIPDKKANLQPTGQATQDILSRYL
jgi:hypothetical protein